MSRSSKIIIGTIIILLLIAIGVWLWLMRGKQGPILESVQNVSVNTNKAKGSLLNNASVTVNTDPAPVVPTPIPAVVDSSAAIKRLASAFAERYGSFSSLGDYENQTDLKPLMSDAYSARTDAAVAALRAKPAATEYFGTTTRAINAKLESLDEDGGNAVVMVKTQRQASTSDGAAPKVTYQDILVTFVKENGAWKVDSAKWQ